MTDPNEFNPGDLFYNPGCHEYGTILGFSLTDKSRIWVRYCDDKQNYLVPVSSLIACEPRDVSEDD